MPMLHSAFCILTSAFDYDLPGLDSNQDKENQNLLCYRYTTGYATLGTLRPIPSGEGDTETALQDDTAAITQQLA